MQVKCPACNAAFSLEAALAVDAGRSALLTALNMLPAPMGQLLAQYLAMFRAGGRALAFARVEKLLGELQPMLEGQTVVRNGLTRRCPQELWRQALERIVEARDAGKLQLPLKSHGYLLDIALGLADRVDANAERETEHARQRGDARTDGEARFARLQTISRIRGDVELGLIKLDEAREQLLAAGINPEVLDAH